VELGPRPLIHHPRPTAPRANFRRAHPCCMQS
jgi:hypothetical protein